MVKVASGLLMSLCLVVMSADYMATEQVEMQAYVGPVAGVSKELAEMPLSKPHLTAGVSREIEEILMEVCREQREMDVLQAEVITVGSTNPEGSGYWLAHEEAPDENNYAGLTEAYVEFINQYRECAQILSIEFGIPWETVMAQGIVESSSLDEITGYNVPGTSLIARKKNNFFGIGAYTDDPYGNALSYASPEEGWRGYYENICRQSTYREYGCFEGDAVTNPHVYLQCITDAGYATEAYVDQVDPLVYQIERYARNVGWYTSAELAEYNPEMLDNAATNAREA